MGDIKKCEKLHFFAFSDTLSQNQCPQNLSASKPCFSGCMYVLPCCVRFIASCILQEGRGRRDKMRKIRQILFDFLSVVGRGAAPLARVLWSQTLRGYIPGRAEVSDARFFQ